MDIIANNIVNRPYRQVQRSRGQEFLVFENIPQEARMFLLTVRNLNGGHSKTLIFNAVSDRQNDTIFEVRGNNLFPSSWSSIPMRISIRFLRTSGSGTNPPSEHFSPWQTVYRHHGVLNLNSSTSRSGGVTGGELPHDNQSIDFPTQGNQNILMRYSPNFTQSSTTLLGADRSVTAVASLMSFHGISLGGIWQTWNNANRFNSNTGNVEIRLHTGQLNYAQDDGNRFDRIIGQVSSFEWIPTLGTVGFNVSSFWRQTAWGTRTANAIADLEFILEIPY